MRFLILALCASCAVMTASAAPLSVIVLADNFDTSASSFDFDARGQHSASGRFGGGYDLLRTRAFRTQVVRRLF